MLRFYQASFAFGSCALIPVDFKQEKIDLSFEFNSRNPVQVNYCLRASVCAFFFFWGFSLFPSSFSKKGKNFLQILELWLV